MDCDDAPQLIEHVASPVAFTPFAVRWIGSGRQFVCVGETPGGRGKFCLYQLNRSELKVVDDKEYPRGIKCVSYLRAASEVVPDVKDLSSQRIEAVSVCDSSKESFVIEDVTASQLQAEDACDMYVYIDDYLTLGTYDGKVQLLQPRESTFTESWVSTGHKGITSCVDACGGGASFPGPLEIVTGGADGIVKVWDIRQKEEVLRLEPDLPQSGCPITQAGSIECWAVALGNNFDEAERCLLAGYDNGDLKLFDLRASQFRWEDNVRNGVCGLQFDRKDIEMNKAVVTTLGGHVFTYDLRTLHPTEGYAKHELLSESKSTIWNCSHLPQNRDIFSVCEGAGNLTLYKYTYPLQRWAEQANTGLRVGIAGELQKLKAKSFSTQPTISCDWHCKKLGLGVTAALDQTIRVIIATSLANY